MSSEVAGIEEDMDSLSANIEYVQENIVELQNDLIAMDDVKCDGDTVDSHSLISSCSPKEAKYLLEHLLDLVLNLVSCFHYDTHILVHQYMCTCTVSKMLMNCTHVHVCTKSDCTYVLLSNF